MVQDSRLSAYGAGMGLFCTIGRVLLIFAPYLFSYIRLSIYKGVISRLYI